MRRARESPVGPAVASGYREHAPGDALRPFVACYWMRDSEPRAFGEGSMQRVLPDGCMDIVFNLADAWAHVSGGIGAWEDARAYVVGAMTEPLVLRPSGRSSMVGVRFRPGGAFAALGVGASMLTDRRVPLGDVWRDRGETLARLVEAPGDAERVCVLECALLRRVALDRRDALVEAAVARILAQGGREPVDALGTALGVTRQHLARRFRERVGVGPKMLARVARVQRVVARLATRPALARVSWSALALECGYYDQAHLAADFRALVGRSPSEYARERG